MGSISEYRPNRWRVEISRKGFKRLSSVFSSYDKAKEFHDEIEREIDELRFRKKLKVALKKVNSRT